MDKPIYLGFAILDLSRILMHETYYAKLQQCFGRENIHLLYMGTDSFVFSMNTKDKIGDLRKLGEIFDLIKLEKIWIDKFVCLRCKMYA